LGVFGRADEENRHVLRQKLHCQTVLHG